MWTKSKRLTPVRQLLSIYRFFWPYWPSARTWEGFIHRLIAPWTSYWRNRWALEQAYGDLGVHAKHRPVVVISRIVGLGDIVACEPVIRQVRSEHPEAFIVFAVHRDYRELLEAHPEVDHVLPLTCVTEWIHFAKSGLFQHIIDLHIPGRACGLCGVPWCKPDGSYGVSGENYYLESSLLAAFSRCAGISAPMDGPKVVVRKKDIEAVNAFALPLTYVCLHAGSTEAARMFPHQKWLHVVEHINRHWGLPVVEIGLTPLVLTSADGMNRSLCGQLSILQSAEVIRRSMLYLGSDSGPAHLANGVGAYGIIALGHYGHYRNYMPYSGNYANGICSELLHHDGPVAEMPLYKICEAIDRRLSSVVPARHAAPTPKESVNI